MVMKRVTKTQEAINEIVEKVKRDLEYFGKSEISFRNIIRSYNIAYCTAYTVLVRAEKVLYDVFGNGIEIFRRKGKLIIIKKEERKEESKNLEEEEKKIEELKKYYGI
jgi:hypothetical protein